MTRIERRQQKGAGFHAFEKKVHDLEEADRAREGKREATSSPRVSDAELDLAMSDVRPPSAHEE